MNDIMSGERFPALYDKHKGQKRLQKINFLKYPTKELFLKHSECSEPFVFKLGGANTDLIDQFISMYGDQRIDVRLGDYASPIEYSQQRVIKKIKIKNYLSFENIGHKIPPYAGNFKIDDSFLHKNNIVIPDWTKRKDMTDGRAWFGKKGCITPLHKDSADNIILNLEGEKELTLYPVKDAIYLYLERISNDPLVEFSPSQIDLRNVNEKRFPHFKNAKSIKVKLNGREGFFLPEGWGHFVECKTKSLMVNFWIDFSSGGREQQYEEVLKSISRRSV